MAESTILTGQFVRISQTPASIGERIIALIIDYVLIGFYIFSTVTVLSKLRLPSDFTMIFFLAVIYLPVLFYSFLCEMFNYGQSLGKRLMNIRVVKADGSVPSISFYLLRWLLFPIDYRRSRTVSRSINQKQSTDGRPCRGYHGYQREKLP